MSLFSLIIKQTNKKNPIDYIFFHLPGGKKHEFIFWKETVILIVAR